MLISRSVVLQQSTGTHQLVVFVLWQLQVQMIFEEDLTN